MLARDQKTSIIPFNRSFSKDIDEFRSSFMKSASFCNNEAVKWLFLREDKRNLVKERVLLQN